MIVYSIERTPFLLPPVQTAVLNKDVLTDKQDGQDPHGDGDLLELAGDGMTDDVRDDADEDTVADAVGQGHEDDGQEGGDSSAVVFPMDASDGRHHHHTNDDQRWSRGSTGDGQEQRTEEQGQRKADGCREGCQSGAAAFANARGTLYVSGGGRCAQTGSADGSH